MCTSDPFHSTDADVSFSESSCTWTMESENGTSVDIAATLNQSIALPSAAIRPPNGIYSHFVMVMSNFINIKGSYTTTDATNGGIFYTKQSPNPASTNSPGLFDKTLTSSQFFKHEFDLLAREVLLEILHRICCEFINGPLVDRFEFFHALFVQSDVQIHFTVCLGVTRRIVRTEAIAQRNLDRTVVW